MFTGASHRFRQCFKRRTSAFLDPHRHAGSAVRTFARGADASLRGAGRRTLEKAREHQLGVPFLLVLPAGVEQIGSE